MPDWHLEAITPRDLDKIHTIERTAFKRPWQQKSFLEELSCDNAFSYAVRGQRVDQRSEIIAYVFLRLLVTEMHILRIAVAREFQNRGVAAWLLRQCFRLAREKNIFRFHRSTSHKSTSHRTL